MNIDQKFLIQVITLNYRIRSSNLLKNLQEQSLNYFLTPGVIPEPIDFAQGKFHSKFLSQLVCQRSLTKGDIGCALAHHETAKNLLNSNCEFGIVFEDDAEIITKFDLNVLSAQLNSKKPVIISLGWIPGFAVGQKSETYKEIVRLITPATCTFAYALNRSAAEILINKDKKLYDLPDWPIHTFGVISYFAVAQRWVMASTDPADSTIGERVPIKDESLVGRVFTSFKLIRNFVILVLISPILKQRLTFKQIINSLILRDIYYKYGRNQVKNSVEPSNSNYVIKPSKKLEVISRILSY